MKPTIDLSIFPERAFNAAPPTQEQFDKLLRQRPKREPRAYNADAASLDDRIEADWKADRSGCKARFNHPRAYRAFRICCHELGLDHAEG